MRTVFRTALLLFLSSCLQGVGEDSGGGGELYSLRNLRVVCTVSTECIDKSLTTEKMYVFYSKNRCSDKFNEYVFIAQSFSDLNCSNGSCKSNFNQFYKDNNKDIEVDGAESGKYTVISYIDLDYNESLDEDEPYFCSENVDINAVQSKNELIINMTNKF